MQNPRNGEAAPGISKFFPAILEAGTSGAKKLAQRGNVGPVGADAACVYRQPEHFRLFDAHTCIIELRQAVAFRRA